MKGKESKMYINCKVDNETYKCVATFQQLLFTQLLDHNSQEQTV